MKVICLFLIFVLGGCSAAIPSTNEFNIGDEATTNIPGDQQIAVKIISRRDRTYVCHYIDKHGVINTIELAPYELKPKSTEPVQAEKP